MLAPLAIVRPLLPLTISRLLSVLKPGPLSAATMMSTLLPLCRFSVLPTVIGRARTAGSAAPGTMCPPLATVARGTVPLPAR